MKKLFGCVLALCMIAQNGIVSFADGEIAEEKAFTILETTMPEEISEESFWRVRARYKDTKEAITLSEYYDGNVFATVPSKNKNREIEAFLPEELNFTDIDTVSGDYFSIEQLASTGVIKGNEKNEAQPLKNVTRAEAVAMIMRFIGLENDLKSDKTAVFEDVTENSWFYDAVMSAYEIGIVNGDSEKTFSPNRFVTREEVTAMTVRALKYADLRCPDGGNDYIADKEEISEWAKEAYDYIGVCYIYDYSDDETDWENPKSYLRPQKPAARAEVADLLNNACSVCQSYPSETAKNFGFDKEMPLIDGSTSAYPITQSVYESLFSFGRTHKQYPKQHSKTHSSYERLINGETDLIFVSHQPSEELARLAEEKGVELELIPIAFDAMVFFTNADNPATGLTTEQISEIYVNNAYENWSEIGGENALLYPYCRNNDSGSHSQMEKYFLNGSEIHPSVKEETSYTMSNILTDVMNAETDDPVGYGLGYSIYYYFKNSDIIYNTGTELKLLEIDGVAPTDETIADGTYPLSGNAYLVLRKDEPEDSTARKLAEFMLTEQGQQCVANAGFGRIEEPEAMG